jgi:hypothetical protein
MSFSFSCIISYHNASVSGCSSSDNTDAFCPVTASEHI